MDGEKAESILKKYNLEVKAEREFAKKTRGERGRINRVLRFRIYSEFLTKKQKELYEQRDKIVKENPNECPNFQTELKRNSYAHPECSFINDRVPKDFCLACSYYKENIKGIDENIKEVSDAIKTYEEKAVIDDIMR